MSLSLMPHERNTSSIASLNTLINRSRVSLSSYPQPCRCARDLLTLRAGRAVPRRASQRLVKLAATLLELAAAMSSQHAAA